MASKVRVRIFIAPKVFHWFVHGHQVDAAPVEESVGEQMEGESIYAYERRQEEAKRVAVEVPLSALRYDGFYSVINPDIAKASASAD